MKKKCRSVLRTTFLTLSLALSSCMLETPIDFDRELMVGTWEQDGLFEVYNDNGTGKTWNENEDVSESEAQPFTWTLKSASLMQIHIMEQGGEIPKIYTVTELTETTLKYEDDFGKEYHFVRL